MRGDLDGILERRSLDDHAARDQVLRLGVGAVGDHAVLTADRGTRVVQRRAGVAAPCRASSSDHVYHLATWAWSSEGDMSSRETAPPRKMSMNLRLCACSWPATPSGSCSTAAAAYRSGVAHGVRKPCRTPDPGQLPRRRPGAENSIRRRDGHRRVTPRALKRNDAAAFRRTQAYRPAGRRRSLRGERASCPELARASFRARQQRAGTGDTVRVWLEPAEWHR